jgi:putative sigma-54 modulation protein
MAYKYYSLGGLFYLVKKMVSVNFILLLKLNLNMAYIFTLLISIYLLFTVKIAIDMNVNIQTVHFDADNKLVDFVNKKLEKLNTFHDRIIKVDVYLKLDNLVHTIKDKIAEIRVHVPRHDFFVKASSKSFEESFDTALDSLVTQIKRRKEREAA